jgi:hypothetical protein
MTSVTRGKLIDVVEKVMTSGKAGELATKLAEPSRQDAMIDVPREGSAKPTRRKRVTKSVKGTQQARQTSIPEDNKVEVSGPPKEVTTPAPQTTNNASAAATGAARTDFVADPEPVPQAGGFLCTFTLSRPGLVGLNRLAIYLNDLQDTGSISNWQTSGWENPATKERALIRFVHHADAIIATKRVH